MVRVFVTGATGLIGNAVARTLRQNGHTVYGLARSAAKAKQLLAQEIIPVEGDLAGIASHSALVATCGAIIHTAFDGATFAETDTLVVNTVLNAKYGSGQRPLFIYTSGVLMHGDRDKYPNEFRDDFNAPEPHPFLTVRAQNEQTVLHATTVHGVVLRPGWVFGAAATHFSKTFDQIAAGKIAVPAANRQHGFIHVDDLAEAYLRVVERPAAHGAGNAYSIVDDSRATQLDVAKAFAAAAGFTGPITPDNSQMWPPMDKSCYVDWRRFGQHFSWYPRHLPITDEAYIYYAAWKASKQA